jgi:hypothetical protein
MLVALVVAVAVGVASSSKALAAGSEREPLRGHQGAVPPGATLIGPAPSTTTLPLVVTLQPRDPAALSAEVQAVSDPHSPDYRHFLTPQQFARRFGPTPASLTQVTAALRSEGLTVGAPSATGLSLPVSGTVAQVQSAFSTPISRYRLASGKTGYDNRSAPEVPVTVAPQIEGILGLDTLSPPQPSTTVPQSTSVGPHSAVGSTPALAPGQPTPTGTCASNITGVEGSYGALDADQLAQAYSFDPLYAANHYGAGSTVALLEMSGAGFSTSDISTFAACYGFTPGAGQITEKNVDGGGATGAGTVEAELDIEDVLSLAPKANIEVYEGGPSDDLYDVFSKIISDDTAKIVSASWTNGCEAYVGQGYQSSENTLFEEAASEGQSIFVATGDEGSEGCNINGEIAATTGTDPVAQAVDPSTGTLYIANKSNNTVSVDSEGSASDPSDFANAGSVPTGSGPDAVTLDSSAGKVFVANSSGSSLTVIPTSTCNQASTSGCSAPTQVTSGGHLSGPESLATNGSTLYVGNNNGTVAVYNATTSAWVATVNLLSSSVPTALAVDTTDGVLSVADGNKNRVEFINIASCNASTFSGCTATPTAVAVGNDPVSLAVAGAAGDFYVGNAGSGGGISVVSLNTHSVVTTISTSQTDNGTGMVQSIAMAPNNTDVLAVLTGLEFPGDVMATINPSTQAIIATVGLQDGTDAMGQLVSDGSRDYVWALDETKGGDIIQNLNLAVSDPASQPYVTAVGGTSLTNLGPAPTETVWNDQLKYSEGAGGGGISQTFSMPAYQQPLGTVSGSTGTPCGITSGDCREVPDVSADADPSTGYVIYDSVNGLGWNALGGTSGAAPLWAAVLAVDASANGNTAGYGALNPALYLLAQQSAGTYLNDVTAGNNDYNATDGGSYPAMTGYDMATGLGTPIASQLAAGLAGIPLYVAVSGSQAYGGSTPTFTASADYGGSGNAPYGVTVNTSGVSCSEVGTSTPIGPALPVGNDTIDAPSCHGATLSGTNATEYTIVYTSAANDFTVNPVPLTITASSPTSTYGTTPTVTPIYSGFKNGDSASSLSVAPTCVSTATSSSPPSPPTYQSSCSGAVDSNYTISYVAGIVTVDPAPLTITASSPTMTYEGAVPTITPIYSGFKNGDSASSLSVPPTCGTTATSSSAPSPPTYPSSCSGAADPNYTISYVTGAVTVDPIPIGVTVSGSQTYGSTTPVFSATDSPPSGITVNTSNLSCSEVGTSTPIGPALPAGSDTIVATSCSGATVSGTGAPDYAPAYTSEAGDFMVNPAPLTITASSPTSTYGSTPTIAPMYSGFRNGDSASSLSVPPTCGTTATSSSTPSPPTYPSSCSGAAGSNYTINYLPGIVTIDQAPLTITASSGSMAYGGMPPSIIPNYSGFVNGDTPFSLSAQPTCGTTATGLSPASPPGTYPSTCSGAAASNYAISYEPGAVTVDPAPIPVNVSGSQSYGSTSPVFSGTDSPPSGITVHTSNLSCSEVGTSTPIGPALPAGSDTIVATSCSGATLSGSDPSYYSADYVVASGDFTVGPVPLMVTASNATMNYGGAVPAIAPIYSGFENGDSASSLSAQPTCGTTATSASAPSPPTYPSSCSGAADSNYTISYAPGIVTVDPAPLTITASSATMNDGGAVPAIAPIFSGFKNGDSASSLSAQPTCGTTATSASAPSTYPSSCSGAADPNYTISYVAGAVTVTDPPAPTPPAPAPAPDPPPTHGYWLVGSDGGIFTFGSAGFYGSTGSLTLQRPVVGITPTTDRSGYWLVASDGGTFAFGDAGFYGSIPGVGLNPAGSGLPHSLNAPIVGMVPAADGQGYFVVASDGGVFAFGPGASFAGSCPGIGGCSGPAVSVIPDASGNGYWLFTATGNVYTFGDAPYLGGPGNVGSSVTSAVRTPDGKGYWVLVANGTVYAYGDAADYGSPGGQLGGLNPATAVFATSDGGGYWVVSAAGAVDTYGDAPNDGGMAGTKLNGAIIAGTGF